MRARTIIDRRDAGWRGGRYPWYTLAWVTWRVNEPQTCTDHRCLAAGGPCVHGIIRERPLSKIFLRTRRLAHEVGHVLERAKDKEFHHPWSHFCGRVGHALRLRRGGQEHLPEGAWDAAEALIVMNGTIVGGRVE